MERNPEQAIVGQFALWISDVNPNRSYWLLVLTNYGIYDDENSHIQNLLKKHSSSGVFSDLSAISSALGRKTRLDVTLDFFLWLYTEDKPLCFRIMKHIYDDFEDGDDPNPYPPVEKLDDFDPENTGRYPDITEEELVALSTQVIDEGNEFRFYQYVTEHTEGASEDVFTIDPYVNHEVVELYLADTPEDSTKRILTDQPGGKFDSVAEKLVKRNGHSIEVRTTPKCHDRLLFIDNQCFLVGISLKDAGRNPNYVVDFNAPERFRQPWEKMWDEAEKYRVFD